MTTVNSSNVNVRLLPWIRQTFQIRWSSMQARREAAGGATGSAGGAGGDLHRRSLVLHIELLSHDQAMIAAWIESAHGQELILDRRTANAVTVLEDGLLHIDVLEDESNARIASLSIIASQSLQSGRLLYARTELLAKAGFAAGRCDPPILEPCGREAFSESA